MKITITDVKLEDGIDQSEKEMVVSGLQSLMDDFYPGLMNDLDVAGCRDILYNYMGPSLVQHYWETLSDDDLVSLMITNVVGNDNFAISEEDDISKLDVLDYIDVDDFEGFYVKATIQPTATA